MYPIFKIIFKIICFHKNKIQKKYFFTNGDKINSIKNELKTRNEKIISFFQAVPYKIRQHDKLQVNSAFRQVNSICHQLVLRTILFVLLLPMEKYYMLHKPFFHQLLLFQENWLVFLFV